MIARKPGPLQEPAPSAAERWRVLARAAGWIAVLVPAVEVFARQLTRAHAFALLPERPLALAAIPLAGLALWIAIPLRGPRRRGRWPGAVPLFTALFAVGLALQLHFGARLQSDGFYYFAYLRSLAFDGDVNFLNDYAMLGQDDKPHLFEPTVTGHAQSAASIGPAIVWAPFFMAGHLAAASLSAAGQDVSLDGTSFPYRQAVCIAGLLYGLIGAWCTFGFAREYNAARSAAIGTALVIGGSFITWYALVEPTMTHAPSMAAVAGFAWLWARTHGRRSLPGWALLGALAGLAGLIRWQNVLFALLPALEAALALRRRTAAGDAAGVRRVLLEGVVFTSMAVIAFLPQLLAWKAIYGTYFAVSPLGPAIDLVHPHLVDVLFSSRNGLLAMSPVLYVAALGMPGLAWRRPEIGVPILAACAAMVWFNASIFDWWGSDGYGGRRFDGIVPLLAPGMAIAFEYLRGLVARRPRGVAFGVLAAAVLWNLTFMSAAQRGVVRLGEALDFGEVAGDQARTLHGWLGHPFSYPVNLWFALRNGVPPAEYDLLSPYRFLGDPTQPYGDVDLGGRDRIYVAEGWHAPEREGPRTFRWSSRSSVVLIPLDHAADLDVEIQLRAFSSPDGLPQQVTIDTGRASFGPIQVPAEWATVALRTDRSAWRAGVTRLRFTFAWAARPAEVSGGGDRRQLAAAIDAVHLSVRGEVPE